MSESLAVTKLMQEAEEVIATCKLCLARGHSMSGCPHLDQWLRYKQRRTVQPGIKPSTLWAAFWCCVVVVFVASGLWRWL